MVLLAEKVRITTTVDGLGINESNPAYTLDLADLQFVWYCNDGQKANLLVLMVIAMALGIRVLMVQSKNFHDG